MVKLSSAGRKALDEFVATTEAQKILPGFAIGVTNLEEEIYFGTGGKRIHSDPTNTDPITRDTVAALQLIEQGKLNLDDPITKWIPQFKDAVVLDGLFVTPNPIPRPAEKVPTVLQLLTHSSGLTYYARVSDPDYGLAPGNSIDHGSSREGAVQRYLEEISKGYTGIPLAFEPGAAFAYGYSTDVLGIVLEEVTGISLADYCHEKIFKPIGIETTFRLTPELLTRLMELSFRNEDRSISPWPKAVPLTQRYPKEVHLTFGGVDSYSTLPDYLQLLRHLMRIEAGKEVQNPVLKQETVKGLFQPQLTPAGAAYLTQFVKMIDSTEPNWDHLNFSTGIAVSTQDFPKGRRAGSGFWTGWAGTLYLMDPTTGIALVSGSQIAPTLDKEAFKLFHDFERIVYSHLED